MSLYQFNPAECIQLRFIAESGFISDAIKVVSRSPRATHVEFITPGGTTIGARSSGGVQERPLDYCKPIWERRYALPYRPQEVIGVMQDAWAKVGTKYDFKDIVGILFEAGIHDPSRAICSTFVSEVLAGRGINLLNVLPTKEYLVTPEMLHLSPYLIGHCTYEFGA